MKEYTIKRVSNNADYCKSVLYQYASDEDAINATNHTASVLHMYQKVTEESVLQIYYKENLIHSVSV